MNSLVYRYLKESGPEKVIYRYVKENKLKEFLESSSFYFKKYDLLTEKPELCFTRNGQLVDIEKLREVSEHMGPFVFIVRFDLLNDLVRNLKIHSVSEYPAQVKRDFIEMFGCSNKDFNNLEKYIIQNNLIPKRKEGFNVKFSPDDSKEISDYIQDTLGKPDDFDFDDLIDFVEKDLAKYIHFIRNREQEERIVLNKNNSGRREAVKIDLNKASEKGAIRITYQNKDSYIVEKKYKIIFEDYIKKYPKLFTNEFINFVRNIK